MKIYYLDLEEDEVLYASDTGAPPRVGDSIIIANYQRKMNELYSEHVVRDVYHLVQKDVVVVRCTKQRPNRSVTLAMRSIEEKIKL